MGGILCVCTLCVGGCTCCKNEKGLNASSTLESKRQPGHHFAALLDLGNGVVLHSASASMDHSMKANLMRKVSHWLSSSFTGSCAQGGHRVSRM